MNKTAITITTINVPNILEGLCQNAISHQQKELSVLVIGDTKTPAETAAYCERTSKEYGIEIEYLDIAAQEKALSEHQDLLRIIPLNTPDRVMLGGMLAYLRGCERLIALDDDNFMTDHDFVGYHSITGTEVELELIESESGWFNVHEALKEENDIPFYPRGFPWGHRSPEAGSTTRSTKAARVVVNQGLVLSDPDIDAISRLFWPIRATGMRPTFQPQFGLSRGTWAPFNYQNTSLCRELIPVYYRPRSTQRNADIWTAYLITRLAQHFDDTICYGQPLVNQIRNPHDLWDDLDVELVNNRATDHFVTLLRDVSLTKNTYFEALGELLTEAIKTLEHMDVGGSAETEMIRQFFVEYQGWYKIMSGVVD